MTCRCGIEWGKHLTTFSLTEKKDHCAWCLLPYNITDEDYEKFGNICSRCSGRCERVVKGSMTIQEADKDLKINRKKNIKIYVNSK